MLIKMSFCLLLILAGFVVVKSQAKMQDTSDWLKMDGVITDVNVAAPHKDGVKIHAKVKLKITNISDKTVFLYRQDLVIVGNKLSLSLEDDKNYVFAYVGFSGAGSSYGSIESKNSIKALDKKVVPKDRFLVIEPSETINVEREAWFDLDEKGIGENRKPWSKIKERCERWLRVGIEVWQRADLEKDGGYKFGKKLQKRWRSEGYLALDYLMSEPIKITFPSSTSCK